MTDERQAFRVRDGEAAGLSRGRMRGPSYVAPHWGIRATAAPQSHDELALCFAPRLPARGFFCGVTAAALWQLPLPRVQFLERIHVGVPSGARRVDTASVTSHHLDVHPIDVVEHRATRVTSLGRTWVGMAGAGVSLAELVAAGDHILRHHGAVDLAAEVASATGRRGAVLLRSALPLLDASSRSAMESHMRVAFHVAGLPNPEFNRRLYDSDGRYLGRPDFMWPQHRVLLEYEGDHHRTDRAQWQRDLSRFGRFQEAGWLALRASAADYRSPTRLLAQLVRLLGGRG